LLGVTEVYHGKPVTTAGLWAKISTLDLQNAKKTDRDVWSNFQITYAFLLHALPTFSRLRPELTTKTPPEFINY
jgi:hypothetical protein